MRITCVIDSLNSGGAQRQMSLLAVLLKERGHEVCLVTYYPHDFYKAFLDEAGIPVECVLHRSKLHRIWAVRRAVRSSRPEVVIAYFANPEYPFRTWQGTPSKLRPDRFGDESGSSGTTKNYRFLTPRALKN